MSSACRREDGRSHSGPGRSRAGRYHCGRPSSTTTHAEVCSPRRRTTLNRLLFPGPARAFAESRERYSDISVIPTRDFLYGLEFDGERDIYLDEGVRLIVGVESISQADERGLRTVMCTINGQLRPVSVRDRSVSSDAPARERADPGPRGRSVRPSTAWSRWLPLWVGGSAAGDVVATIEAMKMEASITAPVAGTVERVALDGPRTVEGGDLVVVVRPD